MASAPATFQRYMDTLLQGMQGVSTYLDDILVTGATIDENLKNLEAVLKKLEDAGLRLNRSVSSVTRFSNIWFTLFLSREFSRQLSRLMRSKMLRLLRISLNYVHSSDLSTTTRNFSQISCLSWPHSTHFSVRTRSGIGAHLTTK